MTIPELPHIVAGYCMLCVVVATCVMIRAAWNECWEIWRMCKPAPKWESFSFEIPPALLARYKRIMKDDHIQRFCDYNNLSSEDEVSRELDGVEKEKIANKAAKIRPARTLPVRSRRTSAT